MVKFRSPTPIVTYYENAVWLHNVLIGRSLNKIPKEGSLHKSSSTTSISGSLNGHGILTKPTVATSVTIFELAPISIEEVCLG